MDVIEAEKSRPDIREMALNALIMINEQGVHSGTVIRSALEKYARLDPRDKAFFVKLIHGTLEYLIRLDAIIDRYSSVKISKMKPPVRNLIRMSLYQILYMDRIPDSAVCDEAVKLIRRSALKNLAGFVNGVLRNIARDKLTLTFSDPCELYSVQKWMYDLLCETVGKESAEAFLEYSLTEHGTAVREVGTDEIRVIENVGNITGLSGWKEGRVIVQDISSSMPVRYAGIKAGDTVIDVCAAPGGKTVQAAEKAGESGVVWACDLTEKKLERIRENVNRLKLKNVRMLRQDAAVRREEFVGLADVVLADLPCSGIGTISGKPEIKNRLSLDDCRELAEIQKKILDNVCLYVRPGGRLVFSTCTLDHFENEDNTKAFVRGHPDYMLVREETLLPGDMPRDGFYIAVFERKNNA